MMWIGFAAMWLSVGGAVTYAIYATGKISPLWFLIIPLFVSVSETKKVMPKIEKNEEDNHE